MNFKEALNAHLNGEAVQVRQPGGLANAPYDWRPFNQAMGEVKLKDLREGTAFRHEFRIKPRTVMCNGVEVPAPESVAPTRHMRYFVPSVVQTDGYTILEWKDTDQDGRLLVEGLVYLDMAACIARTNAMRRIQPC